VIFILNSISGLDKKTRLNVDIIYADPERTASDRLASFGGFFEEEWREHDYRLGRQTAHELLPDILGVDAYPLEPGVDYENPRDLRGVTMADVSRSKRERVRSALLAKAEPLVKGAVGGGWKGQLVWHAVARRKIGDTLGDVLEL
jgi:hypothetical protein